MTLSLYATDIPRPPHWCVASCCPSLRYAAQHTPHFERITVMLAPQTQPMVSAVNVAIALSLVIVDAVVSWALGLGIASSLLVAAGR